MQEKIRLSGIVNDSIVDGTGIRMTVFTQGCPHGCVGCHNPQTHDFMGGYLEDVSSIIDKFKKNPMLKGITLSGGEPFCQAGQLLPLCEEIHRLGKDVWAYSGYKFEELMGGAEELSKELLSIVDVLVDGKFEIDKRDLNLYFRGSQNQRIIDVKKSIEQETTVLLEIDE